MTSASSAVFGSTVLPGEQAERLAQVLRDSRISVLLGPADSGMSALLERMRLCRRAIDRAPSGIRRDGGVIYLPERRSNASVCDVAIHFDEWGDEPLRVLSRRIDEALADRFGASEELQPREDTFGWLADKLLAACRRWNVRFLFVLGSFEVHLAASRAQAGIAAFDDELIEAIKTNVLPANFLFALSDRAAPALERFRDRIIGFPEESLVLPAWRDADRPPALRVVGQAPSEAGRRKEKLAARVEKRVGAALPANEMSPSADAPIAEAPAAGMAAAQASVVEGSSVAGAPDVQVPVAEVPVEPPVVVPMLEVPVVVPVADALVEPPAAESPVVERPVAGSPVVEPPIFEAPVVVARIAAAPAEPAVVDAPVAEAPSTGAPLAEAPVDEASVGAPAVDEASVAERPVDEAPIAERPVDEAPIAEPAVDEAPVAEPPVDEASVAEPPVDEAPVTRAPADAPVVEAPVAGPSTAADPLPSADLASPRPSPSAVKRPAFEVQPAVHRVRGRFVIWVVVVAVGVAAGWMAWSSVRDKARNDPPVANTDEQKPLAPSPRVPVPTTPVRATLGLLIDPDSGIDARVAGELRDRVANSAGLDLQIRPAARWADGLAPAERGLAILRYDALRAARDGGLAGPLQVVMPLYTEPVYVIARSDAPMTFVHQLEGRHVNTGPATSARGMTAARLYRDLFGADVPLGDATYDTTAVGLAKLVGDRGVDAMVVVGSELDSLFADKPPEWKARVKLLRFDPANRASRRVARSFLITTASVGAIGDPVGEGTPGLAEVAFLVAPEPIDPTMAAALGDLARSLCANLPGLQRDGHPKWREVRVGARFDVGWPYVAAVEDALRSCRPPASPVAAPERP